MNSLFIIADNYIDYYKSVVQRNQCYAISYHLFSLCRSNNMSVLSPTSYSGNPSESHQSIISDVNKTLYSLSDSSSLNASVISSIIYNYLYQVYSSFHYLSLFIPAADSYHLCICRKVIVCKDLNELVNAILLRRDPILASYFSDKFHYKILRLLNSNLVNYLSIFQLAIFTFFRKVKQYLIFSDSSSYNFPSIISSLSSFHTFQPLSLHHTTRSTTALLLLIKQFLNLFVDNTTLVDFFGPSNYPVQSLILSSSNTSKSFHQNLYIACRFLLNDAFKKTKYYSRLFRQATVVSIFHAVRFPYLTSLALSLNSSLHKNFLLSHGSHVLHKASSSSSLSDFSIAYGLLFTNLPNIINLSQSPFADNLLRSLGKSYLRITPTMFGKKLTVQRNSTDYTDILYVASFKQLGARFLVYDNSFDLVKNIQNYLVRLSRYPTCRMILNIRFDNIELTEDSLSDALYDFSNVLISSMNISEDISRSKLVVSQSSTVLEEALYLNKYVLSPMSDTYSHFNDLHESCMPYLRVCSSRDLDYAHHTFRSPVYRLSDDYSSNTRMSLQNAITNS